MPEADIVTSIKSIEAGDEVAIETAWENWKSMTVDDVDLTTWRVPAGEDWLTGAVALESGYGKPYRVDVDTDSDEIAHLYRDNDRVKHPSAGPVTELGPAEDEPDVKCGDCGSQFDDRQALSGHQNSNRTDCSPEADIVEVGEEAETDSDIDLPENVTADELHGAVDEADDLEDVAGELDVTVGRARILVRTVDRQTDVADPVATTAYRGGVRSR